MIRYLLSLLCYFSFSLVLYNYPIKVVGRYHQIELISLSSLLFIYRDKKWSTSQIVVFCWKTPTTPVSKVKFPLLLCISGSSKFIAQVHTTSTAPFHGKLHTHRPSLTTSLHLLSPRWMSFHCSCSLPHYKLNWEGTIAQGQSNDDTDQG